MTPERRRRVRLLQASPLIVIALAGAMLFSVPLPLASKMFRMAGQGISIYDPDRIVDDRLEVASEYFERAAREKASPDWADVRFADAAERTWQRMSLAAGEDAEFFSRPGALAAEGAEFEPMREFLGRFGATVIDVYAVPPPTLPPLDTHYAVAPRLLPSADELASLDVTSTYAFMWRAVQGARYPRFDPDAWKPMRAGEPRSVGKRTVRAVTDTSRGAVYRALILHGDNSAQPKARVKGIHTGFPPNMQDTSVCAGCHENHTSVDEGGGWGTAIWYTGPVDLRAVPQFSTRAEGLPSLTTRELIDILAGKKPTTYSSVVWTEADENDPFDHRPTMLFVARFAKDPRADFNARQASWPVRFASGVRVGTAVALPWLTGLSGVLLIVAMGIALHAFTLERRLLADERVQAELARVQRDAHDRIYNRLSALAKQVETIGSEGGSDAPARLADDVRGVVRALQTILGDTGQATASAENVGLTKLLATVAAAQANRHGVAVSFDGDDIRSAPARLGWDLQCVLEEAINNAVRHGGASHITASLRVDGRLLTLTVTDDGVGPTNAAARIAENEAPESGASTGLAGMQARLAAWNGRVELHEAPAGSVLTATARIPMRSSKHSSREL